MKPIKSADVEQFRYLACKYKMQGKYDLAAEAYSTLLEWETATLGGQTSAAAVYMYELAQVFMLQRRNDEARQLIAHAVEVWSTVHPDDYMSLLSYTEALQEMTVNTDHSTVVPLSPRTTGRAA